MSATMTPPPMPAPPPSPAAGATQGMAQPQNPAAVEFQDVSMRVKRLMEALSKMPNVDQQKLQQGRQMLGQAVMIIAESMRPGQPGQPPNQPPGQ